MYDERARAAPYVATRAARPLGVVRVFVAVRVAFVVETRGLDSTSATDTAVAVRTGPYTLAWARSPECSIRS